MKPGDLIRDPETWDVGIVIEVDYNPERFNLLGYMEPYRVVNAEGQSRWFSEDYIENCCEIISKSS